MRRREALLGAMALAAARPARASGILDAMVGVQATGASAVPSPTVVATADFLGGTYNLSGSSSSLSAITSGSTDANGLIIPSGSTGSGAPSPTSTSAVNSALSSVAANFLFVAEMQADANGNAGNAVSLIFNSTDYSDSYALEVLQEASANTDYEFNWGGSPDFPSATINTWGNPNQFAILVNGTSIYASANGGAAQLLSPNLWHGLNLAGFENVSWSISAAGGGYTPTGHVQFFGFYSASGVVAADLPTYSMPGARPA